MNNNKERESLSHGAGIGILVAVIGFVAVWMYFQGQQFQMRAASQTLPPIKETTGLSRFRTDAWYLANEPMLGFVKIPAGPFVMGSDPVIDNQAFENEKWSTNNNQGKLTLSDFYIGRYEVTVAQFRAFAEASGYKIDVSALQAPGDYPVTYVSWTDALAYSRWLTATLKQSPQTPSQLKQLLDNGWQFTLPNEAQWEKAARSSDGRIFPWGNSSAGGHANFHTAGTRAVGSFTCTECAFGLADMSGNAWELTLSPYQRYPFDLAKHADTNGDALFIMRGGSFNDTESTIRTATRGGIDPGARREFIGFRVVLAIATP